MRLRDLRIKNFVVFKCVCLFFFLEFVIDFIDILEEIVDIIYERKEFVENVWVINGLLISILVIIVLI